MDSGFPVASPIQPSLLGSGGSVSSPGNGPVMVQIPDYVWQQLLLPALKAHSAGPSASLPSAGQLPTPSPAVRDTSLSSIGPADTIAQLPEPNSVDRGKNQRLVGNSKRPKINSPTSRLEEGDGQSKPNRSPSISTEEDIWGSSSEDDHSTRDLVRRFETQAVHYLKKHPEARQKLEDAEERLTDLVANPEDALDGVRLELQFHPMIKGAVWLAQPIIRHEIKQLPDKASERAPFLNRSTAMTVFNYITESDKAHEKREGPIALDI
jgi:hypothetical protein